MTRDVNEREAPKPAETQHEGSGSIVAEEMIPRDLGKKAVDEMTREYFGAVPKHPLPRGRK